MLDETIINKQFVRRWGLTFAYVSIICALLKYALCPRKGGPYVEIMLVGDSLIERTNNDFNTGRLIQYYLTYKYPKFNIEVSSKAKGGDTISRIRRRLHRDVLQRKGLSPPLGLIMYWDSDASDIEFDKALTSDTLEAYTADLRFVISELKANIPYVALSGPTIFGEQPRGTNMRDKIYDYYEAINVNITREFGIQYIPTRQKFFNAIPSSWPFKEYLTQDTEHLNGRGEKMIRSAFLETINSWPIWRDASLVFSPHQDLQFLQAAIP